jgi:hypothetical protein
MRVWLPMCLPGTRTTNLFQLSRVVRRFLRPSFGMGSAKPASIIELDDLSSGYPFAGIELPGK